MKVLHCKSCGDVVRLYSETRACHCGKSLGRYDDDGTYVLLRGPCRALGIHTGDLIHQKQGSWTQSARVRHQDGSEGK